MKTQILPNWFKKVGLILFIVGSIIGGADDNAEKFNDGYNTSRFLDSKDTNIHLDQGLIIEFFGGKKIIQVFYVLSFIGMLIYMLAKEKVEDDYINKLRLESFQLTSIIALIVVILLIIAFSDSKKPNIQLEGYLPLFFWFYLITFYIKKRIDL